MSNDKTNSPEPTATNKDIVFAHPGRPGNTGTSHRSGRSPGSSGATKPKIYAPIPAWGTHGRIGGHFGDPRSTPHPHIHAGLDVDVPTGSACVAPCDGTIGHFAVDHGFAPPEGPQQGGGMVQFVFPSGVDNIAAGTVIGWGHVFKVFVKPGQSVKGGQIIARSGYTTGGAHVHFVQRGDSNAMDGSVNPEPLFNALQKGETIKTSADPSSSDPTGTGGTGSGDSASVARAAALSTFLELPGIFNTFESRALAGQKSLMNDQPLLPFIQQLTQASLRNFQSMPNGNFFAYFPDYFGGLDHRTAYWQIEDIEIMDGEIDLSDDALATHVYVTGDIFGFDGQISIEDKLFSSGVVTLFNAFAADFINGIPNDAKTTTASTTSDPTHPKKNPGTSTQSTHQDPITSTGEAAMNGDHPTIDTKDKAINFMMKYGARPHFEEAPMVRSPFFELFLAYQKFMLLWSQQFLTTFTFTFMPELYPGGLVAFPTHGIQCYINEVTHSFDFKTGFTTQANLSAPSALPNGRKNVNEGMIRAFTLGDDLPFDPFADAGDKRKGDKK